MQERAVAEAAAEKFSWHGIAPWLKSLHLSAPLEGFVAEAFMAHDVNDLSALLKLSEEDLKAMKLPIGARKKVLMSTQTIKENAEFDLIAALDMSVSLQKAAEEQAAAAKAARKAQTEQV